MAQRQDQQRVAGVVVNSAQPLQQREPGGVGRSHRPHRPRRATEMAIRQSRPSTDLTVSGVAGAPSAVLRVRPTSAVGIRARAVPPGSPAPARWPTPDQRHAVGQRLAGHHDGRRRIGDFLCKAVDFTVGEKVRVVDDERGLGCVTRPGRTGQHHAAGLPQRLADRGQHRALPGSDAAGHQQLDRSSRVGRHRIDRRSGSQRKLRNGLRRRVGHRCRPRRRRRPLPQWS